MSAMRRLVLMLAAWCLGSSAHELRHSGAPLTVDGALADEFWRQARWERLEPTEPGVPQALGGEVNAGFRGSYLCVAARLPEPRGRVLARSQGRDPVWEKDALESNEVEDRVRFEIRQGGRARAVEVNPWGAYRREGVEQVLPAASVGTEGWTVEVAIPVEPGSGDVELEVLRIRSRRPLAPEFRWSWRARGALAPGGAALSPPEHRPVIVGNNAPPLEAGRLSPLPRVVADWDDPAWQAIPEFQLPRNEPLPRAPRYPTRVKWAHDGRKLALIIRADEPEPVVARSGGRDSAVTGDDHVAVYLATSGSAFLEIAVNTVGALRDARGSGPRIMRPNAVWNAAIERQTQIRHGYWVARLDIPLDECAQALGETGIPREWRVLVARLRAARPGEPAEWSALPVIGATNTFYGPARYQRLKLNDGAAAPVQPPPAPPSTGLAAELTAQDPNVWTPLERRYRAVRSMLARWLDRKVEEAVWAERRAWDRVQTRADWEAFRDQRIRALRESVGVFPPPRPPLAAQVSARLAGRGYRLENVAFQSRQSYWATANLYLPERPAGPRPALIIVHSQHFPKTQGELHDMGELWARTGCVVLILERPGYGERVETTPWYRQSYASRFNYTRQLFLVGESYSGWAAWDIIRAVDYLWERPEVDRAKIILLGAVAGGGEPSAVAAALDERIAAVAPFNYDQGHVRVHGDSPAQIARQFSPWLVAASVAPRRFIRAFEFGWEGAEEPDYPNLWVDGMKRSEKVWDFYGARQNLAASQGFGLIRLSMERASHCFSIGPEQREELFPPLERWFGIPYPEAADRHLLPDSQLSSASQRDQARQQERRRRPHSELLSIPPALNARIERKKAHELAREMADGYLRAARARSGRHLASELAPLLGDIEPVANAPVSSLGRRTMAGAEIEAASLGVDNGIDVPLLLVHRPGARRAPVVVAVAQGGKGRFLAQRSPELARLVEAGIAVALVDVRGTGETAASPDGTPNSLAQTEFDLGRNLLGSRLKDLRTALAWLRRHPAIDPERMAIWGESFSPPNPPDLVVDELEYEVGPHAQFKADPLGAHLALLAGLYEPGLRAIAARGGLHSYRSVLDEAFTYVPMDVIVLGILKVADIDDIAQAIRPRSLLLDRQVTGRNLAVPGPAPAPDLAGWLEAALRR